FLFTQAFAEYEFENGHTLSGSYSRTKNSFDLEWSLPNGFVNLGAGFGDFPNFTPGTPGFAVLDSASIFKDVVETETNYAEIRYAGDFDINENVALDFIVSGEWYDFENVGEFYPVNRDAFPDTFSLIDLIYLGGNPFAQSELFPPAGNFGDVQSEIYSLSFLFSLDLYERLRINGGVRHDDREGVDGFLSDDPEEVANFESDNQSYSGSIAFDITDTITAYYAYAEGFEFVNELQCDGSTAPPEENESHELGLKWEPNPNLLGSIAYFDNEAINGLIEIDCPPNSANPTGSVLSDAQQTGEGVELEVVGSITPQWNIAGGISYIDDAFEFDISGTPEFSVNFFTTYDFAEGSALEKFAVGGGVRAAYGRSLDDVRSIDIDAIPDNIQSINGTPLSEAIDADGNLRFDRFTDDIDNYILVDALVSYDLTDAIQLRLNARNLFDEYYLRRLYATTSGMVPGEPRTFLATIDFDF
ncbi:MAG: TonB-dependent receptor, partial [Pseudomonadota bacterium]